jgi:hypothetical protein
VSLRGSDRFGGGGCAFSRRQPPVVAVWVLRSKLSNATRRRLASSARRLSTKCGRFGCGAGATRDVFCAVHRYISSPLLQKASCDSLGDSWRVEAEGPPRWDRADHDTAA